MAGSSRRVIRLAQWLLALAVVGLAVRELARQWEAVTRQLAVIEPRWERIALSGVIVLATYFVLIQAWRLALRLWSASLGLGTAARIWFISNLGKYVPGKVWQIAAMGVMAQREHVPAAAAIGSSLLVNLVNVIAGFAVILITGARDIASAVASQGGASVAAVQATIVVVAVAGTVVILLAPAAVPGLAAVATRLTGRAVTLPTVPVRAVWLTVLATGAAWILYGVAFALFATGVSRDAAGSVLGYVAVYTGSYLAGYLALVVPGGLGVREAILVLAMPRLGLATAADAAVIAVTSRLWLTVLEIAPALVFLARRRPGSTPLEPLER